MLIETGLSASSLLLYYKTNLKSLILCAVSVWLAYFWKPLAAVFFLSLMLLLREINAL